MKIQITIILAVMFTSIQAQTIEKFSIDSGGASTITGGIDILYTIGETNVQELVVGGIYLSEGFINGNFGETLDIDQPQIPEKSIVVYPNPVSKILNVKSNFEIEKIEVYDILGKLMFSSSETHRIELNQLSSGVYVLKFLLDGKTLTKRIVVDKL